MLVTELNYEATIEKILNHELNVKVILDYSNYVKAVNVYLWSKDSSDLMCVRNDKLESISKIFKNRFGYSLVCLGIAHTKYQKGLWLRYSLAGIDL